MIVEVTFPANVSQVRYGQIAMMPDENHVLQVPAYVAKSLAILPNVAVTGDISGTVQQLLAATTERYEISNFFNAYGKSLPVDVVTVTPQLNDDGSQKLEEDGNPVEPVVETTPVDWLAATSELFLSRGEPIVSVS